MSVNTCNALESAHPGKKKRGGQPGNTNALKHGFYTKNFSLTERRSLQEIEGVVLSDEIGLLRVLIRRFANQIKGSQGVSLNDSAQAEADSIRISAVPHTSVCGLHLSVISEAMLRLASLLRTDNMLGGSDHDKLGEALARSMSAVLEELREDAG